MPELLELGWSNEASASEQASGQAAFSYRMVEVVMMLMLPLLAVALAIPPKRSTSALGVFPLLSLWGPFVLFGALIGWMYFRVAFVPGGQAIGALESFYAKVAKRVKALLRRRGRARRRDPDVEQAVAGAA